jgi:hypothetical protein
MPALGESVSEGTVTRWLKGVGDSVAVDEALLEVSTDKAVFSLRPRRAREHYQAEVRITSNGTRGVACRGEGAPKSFRLEGERLICPLGWVAMIDPSVDGYRK